MDNKFEVAMNAEVDYRKREYAAVQSRDYQAAAFFHDMRWRCMDAALRVLNSAWSDL